MTPPRHSLEVVRSVLFCPANRPDMIAKTPRSGPDAIAVDLEDAVPPAAKEGARQPALEGARQLAASGASGLRLLRLNAVGSPWHDADLELVADSAWDGVIVPKVEREEDLRSVRLRLENMGRADAVVVAGLESMAGVAAAQALAPLADGAFFGAEDFIADLGGTRTPGNQEVAFARSATALAVRLAGAAALDMVTIDLRDQDRFAREAREARALGYTGKLCVHPSQVALANAAFTPDPQELERARRLVATFDAAGSGSARGVIDFEGEMVDLPLYRRARALLDRAAPR